MSNYREKRNVASVIIPNFNGRDLLAKNFPSVVAALKNPENLISEVIIVDDGSDDESVSFIKENYSEIKLIKHTKNRGFSAAINTGARTAKGKLLVLLNNDVSPSPNFLLKVIPHFEDKQDFAVSLHEKGYGWAKGKFENGFIVHEKGIESKEVHESFWANGGAY